MNVEAGQILKHQTLNRIATDFSLAVGCTRASSDTPFKKPERRERFRAPALDVLGNQSVGRSILIVPKTVSRC